MLLKFGDEGYRLGHPRTEVQLLPSPLTKITIIHNMKNQEQKTIDKVKSLCEWEINMAQAHPASEESKWRSFVARRILEEINEESEAPKEPAYTPEEVLLFITANQIGWNRIGSPLEADGVIEFIRITPKWHTDQTLCFYPWDDENSLLEGIYFLMDMDKANDVV